MCNRSHVQQSFGRAYGRNRATLNSIDTQRTPSLLRSKQLRKAEIPIDAFYNFGSGSLVREMERKRTREMDHTKESSELIKTTGTFGMYYCMRPIYASEPYDKIRSGKCLNKHTNVLKPLVDCDRDFNCATEYRIIGGVPWREPFRPSHTCSHCHVHSIVSPLIVINNKLY